MGVRSVSKHKCPLCRETIASCRSANSDEAFNILIEQYHKNNTGVNGNEKTLNIREQTFNIILKPFPQSLRTHQNEIHPDDKIYLKTATPNIMTGNQIHNPISVAFIF